MTEINDLVIRIAVALLDRGLIAESDLEKTSNWEYLKPYIDAARKDQTMSGSELKAAVQAADKPALEQLIDGLFAGLELRYASNKAAVLVLKGLNGAIDGFLAAFSL